MQLWETTETEKTAVLNAIKNTDYTIVVYWNIWSKYYSKVILKELHQYLKIHNNPKKQITVILVNTAYD